MCAVCPACCKILDGDVVVSSCDHVFHRACLLDADGNPVLNSCPTCGDPVVRHRVQALYGVCFGAGADSGAAKLAEASAGCTVDCDSDVVVDSADARIAMEVAEMSRLQESVRQREEQLELKRQEVQVQLEYMEHQVQKRQKAEHATKRLEDKRVSQQQEMTNARLRYESQLEELNKLRLRDTVLDYSERLRREGQESGLDYLLKMVKIVSDPSKVIVDINRLRAHHRKQFSEWLRESGTAKQQLFKVRQELEETKRATAELKAKLQRAGGGAADRGGSQEGSLPKRPRVADRP